MLEKKISIKLTLIISVLGFIGTVFFYQYYIDENNASAKNNISNVSESLQTCDYNVIRLNGYKLIKPLLFIEPNCESSKYGGLKYEITSQLKDMKSQGRIIRGSVYFKDFQKGEWMSINESELYHPSSLIKVPMLITYLLMGQKDAKLLNAKLVFEKPEIMAHQTYNSLQVKEGKSYTIKELLKYMVVYSDNNATFMLNTHADMNVFNKLYSDIGLKIPDVHDKNYTISAREYSQFLRLIFSGNYLTIDNSEYAAELLSQCEFKEGMQKFLPKDISIAHKFGEWGDGKDLHQLSESGIVYLNNNPYLITVMTEGKDVKELANVIADISKVCYVYMNDHK